MVSAALASACFCPGPPRSWIRFDLVELWVSRPIQGDDGERAGLRFTGALSDLTVSYSSLPYGYPSARVPTCRS